LLVAHQELEVGALGLVEPVRQLRDPRVHLLVVQPKPGSMARVRTPAAWGGAEAVRLGQQLQRRGGRELGRREDDLGAPQHLVAGDLRARGRQQPRVEVRGVAGAGPSTAGRSLLLLPTFS
jgi:hypothetical protein